MRKQETDDEYFSRVKAAMTNAKSGELVFLKKGEPTKVVTKVGDLELMFSGHGEQQKTSHCILHYKGILKRALVIASMFLMTSCYVTTLTHSEAMDQSVLGETKENIIARAGLPDAKQVEGEYEQWTYYGNQTITTYNRPSRTTTTGSVVPGSHNAYGDVNSGNVATQTYSYGGGSTSQVSTQYLKLMFKDDVVIGWDTQGIDISEKEPDTGRTLIAAGAVVIGIVMVILGASAGL